MILLWACWWRGGELFIGLRVGHEAGIFPAIIFQPRPSALSSSGQQTTWSKTYWSWRQYWNFIWYRQRAKSGCGRCQLAYFRVRAAWWWWEYHPGGRRRRNQICVMWVWNVPSGANRGGSRWWTCLCIFIIKL